jgi:two-component system, cell cycle response regulator
VTDDYRDGGTLILSRPLTPEKKPPAGDACLVNLHPPGPDIGRRIPLINAQYIVGRDSEAGFVVSRSSVSRQHARLYADDDGNWWVEDLNSTNGTFVNEQRIRSQQLTDADQVRFGDAIYKFLSGSNIESAYHEAIHNMAIQDGMTGIHNKRFFMEFLEREIAVASRHGHPLTLVMFDVDHFKKVNDTHGHQAGDHVLSGISTLIGGALRAEDVFARYGGEEFAVICRGTDLAQAQVVGERIRRAVEKHSFVFEGTAIPVTISVGIAGLPDPAVKDAADLVARADKALYQSKHGGRNRVTLHQP